jgi:hypothetical protein
MSNPAVRLRKLVYVESRQGHYQLGQLYQKLGKPHDAEKTFRTGITVAAKANDEHTRSELEAALEGLLGGQ